MDKIFETVLELRWSEKNPRIICDDGEDVIFFVNGDRHPNWVVLQKKEGLKNFYHENPDRYHGNLWLSITDIDLCEWIQNVTLALEKNKVSRNNMYLATREIFSLKEDPTEESTITKIYDILKKYFGNIEKDFNLYYYIYRYKGIRDITHLFLIGYAFHYGNCIRYIPGNKIFNLFRSLKYKDMFYRTVHFTSDDMDKNENSRRNLSRTYWPHYEKIETETQTIERIRDAIVDSETGIEMKILQGEKEKISEEKIKEIKTRIDKEISDNEKIENNEKIEIVTDFDNKNKDDKKIENKDIEKIENKDKLVEKEKEKG